MALASAPTLRRRAPVLSAQGHGADGILDPGRQFVACRGLRNGLAFGEMADGGQVACGHSGPEAGRVDLRQAGASGANAKQALVPVRRETCGQVLRRRRCVGFGQIMGRLQSSEAQINQVRKAGARYRLGQRLLALCPSLESEGEDLAGMRGGFRRVCLKIDNHHDAHAEN